MPIVVAQSVARYRDGASFGDNCIPFDWVRREFFRILMVCGRSDRARKSEINLTE